MASIHSLSVHPVKSCGGIALERARLVATGFEHDREWVIVDPRDHFLTQRDEPRMALLRTHIGGDALELSAPGRPPLHIPLAHEGDVRPATVWRSQNPAFDAGDEAAAWLGEFLGRAVRLMRFDPRHRRLSNRDWTGDIEAPNLFTDGYPIMVLSLASIADLSARVGRELPLDRFRANLVLDGLDPYAEDAARELQIGGVTLRLVKPCTRCVIITTDQATGERDGDEPLRTLRGYRMSREQRGVVFGMNAVIAAGHGGTLTRGQSVTVR